MKNVLVTRVVTTLFVVGPHRVPASGSRTVAVGLVVLGVSRGTVSPVTYTTLVTLFSVVELLNLCVVPQFIKTGRQVNRV